MNASLKIAAVALAGLALGTSMSRAQSDGGSFKLKHRSTFSSPATRNPFWPIGWVKGADNVSNTQEAEADIRPENFTVTSISISTIPQAIINGKIYAEGETINAMFEGQKVKILLAAVHDGEIVLNYQGRKIVVPVKRPELQAHKSSGGDDTSALPAHQNDTIILH